MLWEVGVVVFWLFAAYILHVRLVVLSSLDFGLSGPRVLFVRFCFSELGCWIEATPFGSHMPLQRSGQHKKTCDPNGQIWLPRWEPNSPGEICFFFLPGVT